MKQTIELKIPNTLKKEGVKGIFYEGRIICISYTHHLITWRVNKQNQIDTLNRLDKVAGPSIDEPTKDEIKLCIAADWEFILTCKTEVPLPELDGEALELNQREHLDRLDKLCGFNKNANPECIVRNPYSRIFSTYVTIEENKARWDH